MGSGTIGRSMRGWTCVMVGALLAVGGTALAQERFSFFVGSNPEAIERMVRIADLQEGDVVTDLGSGDGRIVIAAVQSRAGVRGWGVDVDEKLVNEANAEAKKLGLAERVQFFHRNAFDADPRQASVIFMWLWPELMHLLRTKILAEARPGTRVVTSIWDLGNWKPDRKDDGQLPVNLWVVPARVAGNWNWELTVGGIRRNYAAILDQYYQNIEGVVRAGDRRRIFLHMKITGDNLSLSLDMTRDGTGPTRHEFNGRVSGDRIIGTVRTVQFKGEQEISEGLTLQWQATRAASSAHFAPTGLEKR
jgi:Methyltransferase domain